MLEHKRAYGGGSGGEELGGARGVGTGLRCDRARGDAWSVREYVGQGSTRRWPHPVTLSALIRCRAPSHRAALSMSHSLRSELLRPTPVARWRIPYSVAPHLGRWLAGGGASAGWQWRCGVARGRVRRTGVRSLPVIYRPIPLQPVPLPSLPLPPVPLPCPCRPPGSPLQREGVQLRRLVDCAPE